MAFTKPLVHDSIVLLKLFGVNLENSTVWGSFRCAAVLLSFYIMVCESFLNVMFNWKGVDSMFDLTTVATLFQISAKVNAVAFDRQKLRKIFGVMNQFWQVQASHDEIADIYRSVQLGYRIGLFITMLCVSAYYGFSVMFRTFPITMYYPSSPLDTPFYGLTVFFQVFVLFIASGYFGCEYLFFTGVTYIVCEFKLIKERVLQLPHKFEANGDAKQLMQELGLIIDQQNLVFEFLEIFSSFYSPIMLTVFCTCIFILSASLSSVVIKSSVDGEVIMLLFLFMYFLMLLFAYGWAGNTVMTSSEDVLNGILESDAWLVQEPRFKKSLILVMLRSQKLAKIRAAGMLDFNLETFTRVVNSAFSFFSLFKATYGKSGRN